MPLSPQGISSCQHAPSIPSEEGRLPLGPFLAGQTSDAAWGPMLVGEEERLAEGREGAVAAMEWGLPARPGSPDELGRESRGLPLGGKPTP